MVLSTTQRVSPIIRWCISNVLILLFNKVSDERIRLDVVWSTWFKHAVCAIFFFKVDATLDLLINFPSDEDTNDFEHRRLKFLFLVSTCGKVVTAVALRPFWIKEPSKLKSTPSNVIRNLCLTINALYWTERRFMQLASCCTAKSWPCHN